MLEFIHNTPPDKEGTGKSPNGVVGVLHDGPLDAQHTAVLAYTDAMTLSVTVPDAVFEQLKQHFSERGIVEITATVAAYNCVSRFLVALDVGEKNRSIRTP